MSAAASEGNRSAALREAQRQAHLLFEEIERSLVRPGITESALSREIHALAAERFGVGQVCLAGTRILVDGSIADDLLGRVRTATEAAKVGDPRDAHRSADSSRRVRTGERVRGAPSPTARGRSGAARRTPPATSTSSRPCSPTSVRTWRSCSGKFSVRS